MKSLIILFSGIFAGIFACGDGLKAVTKDYNGEVYIHIMPWFETKETNNGSWGQHWTMNNQNPDIIDENGRRQIAAHYYPEIGPYASGDEDVVEYQLQLMKYAGVAGVFIDWPGTLQVWDYVGNKHNSEIIITVAERVGLKFAIVYEDHNIGMASDAGFITDKIDAAQADMIFLRDNYFTENHYLHIDGVPVLLDFGPQTFQSSGEWDQIFSVFSVKPNFFTLWNEMHEAGDNAIGEYCWIWIDFLLGLTNFYKYREIPMKIGGAYPGFHTFYSIGGWPGDPGWSIPVGVDTWTQTLDLALEAEVDFIQLNTWNDYGEGTMIEPTIEFGNQFLTILQQKLGVQYTGKELNLAKELYLKRKEHKGNSDKEVLLAIVAEALNNLDPDKAEVMLKSI